eukprot:327305_1
MNPIRQMICILLAISIEIPTTITSEIPTNDPTAIPTLSPFEYDCGTGYNMDLIFLVDTSCVPYPECSPYLEGIAELMSSIKGEFAMPPIGIIAFDGYSIDVIVPLNSTDYNNYRSRGSYYIGLGGKIALYNEIRSITCPGNNGDNTDKSTSVLSAIQVAFNMFTHEDKRDPLSRDISERYKKIVLFSTCLNTEGSAGETATCNAYESTELKVEFIVFNALTSTSNLNYNQYLCLTENDREKQYSAGRGRGFPVTLNDMTSLLDGFKTEICSEPTPEPTASPTQTCQHNSQCPQGMKCCPEKHICEPESMVPNAKMAFDNIINEPRNDVINHSYYEY